MQWKLISVLCLVLLLPSSPMYAQVQLVSEREMRASENATAPLAPRSVAVVPDGPKIDIVSPGLMGAVKSPARVQLRFTTVSPAIAKPESFKALYGAFRVDITSRLLKVAKLSPQGLIVEEAFLPSGSHRIFLEIEDSVGRTGGQMLSVMIE